MEAQGGQEIAAQREADPMINMIERLVLNPDADLNKLERMLVMKERMDAQNARISFARALADARAQIPPIIKDATVDFKSNKGRTHYKHETLAGIARAIDPVLSAHGLSYRFRTDQGQGGVRVTCIVQHSDGHAEETTLVGAPDQSGNKNGFQSVGSAVTYLQRYTLKAALGLSAEVDDDAQSAAPRPDDHQQSAPPRPSENEIMADRMVTDLRKYGVERVTSNERFQADFERLRAAAPDIAARVDAEIEALSPPPSKPGPDLDPFATGY
ncbi:ERF family protein [Roseobacter sp. AzwK-3b]|uniref:ERF family protein n=1 Tax=Roseobacter sp. AzwK-3b TaxID=351016 RepID=UPI0012F50AA7|nr:ERF family protein [Roseobacter sp. AzwK-3b]